MIFLPSARLFADGWILFPKSCKGKNFMMFFSGRRPCQLFRMRFWGAGLELPEGRGMGNEEGGGGGDSV